MYYHPKDTRNAVDRGKIDNFALWFTHFLHIEKGKKKNYEVTFPKETPRLSPPQFNLLEALQQRRHVQLRALQQQYALRLVRGTVDWRMVIGLGGEHVLETSMTLHHVYGVPYIPGSAVKGMVRHYFISEVFAKEAPNEELDVLDAVLLNADDATLKELRRLDLPSQIARLKKVCKVTDEGTLKKAIDGWQTLQLGQQIFGTPQQRGAVTFLDALPDTNVRFQADIMNPHYPDYYADSAENSSVPPNDCQNPIPIPFLTIENAAFTFAVHTAANADEALLTSAANWLQKALEDQGIGAKSAVGYGYFVDVDDYTETFDRERKLAQQEAKEKAERERLESLPPLERMCAELEMMTDTDVNVNRSYAVYQDELPQLEGDDKLRLAAALKAYWQKIGRWSGKGVSKKQKAKVQDIRQILGE